MSLELRRRLKKKGKKSKDKKEKKEKKQRANPKKELSPVEIEARKKAQRRELFNKKKPTYKR
ncbi:MAG: hypothetical protein ACTSRS_17535 [Candidatus Helarchaeota archaeon]